MRGELIGVLLAISILAGCGGEGLDTEEQAAQGVEVTATVPHSTESVQDIIDRERDNPSPPRGDWVPPTHDIHRAGEVE